MLTRPVHRGLTLNDILPRLAGMKYLTLICESSGYHNQKLDEKSSYLTTFLVHLVRTNTNVPFAAAAAGDMFQKKTDKLCCSISCVFGIADDILQV